MNVLRHCEREIVRALVATGSTQSQVTHADRFEIATDDVVVKVWTVDAYERERGAVDPMRQSRIARARGLAQAIAECRDDARLDGIREGAAEIVTLLGEQ